MAKSKAARKISLGGRIDRDKLPPGRDDATPERLRHARNGGAASIVGQGTRRIAEPFDVLRTRQLLDRSDAGLNERLWQAGDRLRGHWHRAMLDGLSALDPTRAIVDAGGGGPGALNPTETALRHRDHWRQAAACVGPRLFPYLEAIVIAARPVGALRSLVAETGHARTAEALVLERLREGLHRLCDLWRMHPPQRRAPITSWHDRASADPPEQPDRSG